MSENLFVFRNTYLASKLEHVSTNYDDSTESGAPLTLTILGNEERAGVNMFKLF